MGNSNPDSNPEFIKLIAGLIQSELDLLDEQSLIYNQEFQIPPDERLYVSTGVIANKVFGATNGHCNDPFFGLVQNQTVNTQETYSITVYSKGGEARRRRHEIIFALIGDRAQQTMEKYAFKIGYVPTSFVDVSEGEGASRINRYVLTINVLVAYSRTRAVEYFDQFQKPPYTLITNP